MTPVPITDFLSVMEQFVRLANLFFDRMLQLHGLSSTEVKLLLFLSCHPDCGLARDVVRLRTLSKASVSRRWNPSAEGVSCLPPR